MTEMPSYPGVRIDNVTISGPHGEIPARTYRPPEPAAAVAGFVWVHGGAFIGGDLDMPEAEWVGRVLASRGIAVVSLDYRQAVEGTTVPVPSDDVLAGWLWAVDHVADLGVTLTQLHLGGASAGGNLAASVSLRCRDGAGPLPASLVLVYPDLHAELPAPSRELAAVLEAETEGRIKSDLAYRIALNYVGDEARFDEPYAFPASGSLPGLPPTFILNAEADDLRASGEDFAELLRAAHVPVRVEFEPGSRHGYLNDWLDQQGQLSIDRIVDWLEIRRHGGGRGREHAAGMLAADPEIAQAVRVVIEP